MKNVKKIKNLTTINKDKYFLKYYTNPKNPGSFSGLTGLYKALNEKEKTDKNRLEKWIQSLDTYTLHKPKYKTFERNKTIVPGREDTWQADLIDMNSLTNENDGNIFILMVIDVFSKYAWSIPLKNKKAETVIDAFKKIFLTGRKPKKIHTDKGSEFFNSKAEMYFKKLNIQLYSIDSETKAAVVERFNRTIKERMWRLFTFNNNHRYIDI